MQRDTWEYKTVTVPLFIGKLKDSEVDQALGDIGKDGWELVTVSPVVHEQETISLIHHFRRLQEKDRTAGFRP